MSFFSCLPLLKPVYIFFNLISCNDVDLIKGTGAQKMLAVKGGGGVELLHPFHPPPPPVRRLVHVTLGAGLDLQTLAAAFLLHEALQQVDGKREDDGGVLLGGDGVEGLQITELQGGGRLRDDVSGFLQSA